MSRYVIPARQPQTTCVVGYDPPFGDLLHATLLDAWRSPPRPLDALGRD